MAVVWDNNWQFVWNGCGLGQQLAVCEGWLWVGTTTGSLCGMMMMVIANTTDNGKLVRIRQ
jgi:hypothetical protein